MPVALPASPAASLDEVFSGLVQDSVASMASPAQPEDDSLPAGEPEVDTPESETPEEVPEKPGVLPEGMVAVPKIDRALATEFTVSDKEGALEPPDLTITFMANGKQRQESLDQVVRLAQYGTLNWEKRQEADRAIQALPAVQAEVAQARSEVERIKAQFAALMESDEAYLDAREEYEKRNTPEARLAEREQAFQEQQNKIEYDRAAESGRIFAETRLEPALDTIAKALPTISTEELSARIVLAMNHFVVQTPYGRIYHPDSQAAITQMITQELLPWAQDTHKQRMAERQTVTTTAQTQVKKAQVESQRAKNLASAGMKPVGKAAASANPPRRVARTVDEVNEDVLRDTLAMLR